MKVFILFLFIYINPIVGQDSLYHIANNVYWRMPRTSEVMNSIIHRNPRNKYRVDDDNLHPHFIYNRLDYSDDSVVIRTYCSFDYSTELTIKAVKEAEQAGFSPSEVDSIGWSLIIEHNNPTYLNHKYFPYKAWYKKHSGRINGKYLYADMCSGYNHGSWRWKKFLFWEKSINVDAFTLKWSRYILIDSIMYEFYIDSKYRLKWNKECKNFRCWRKQQCCIEKALYGDFKKQFDHFVNGIVIKEEEEE